MQHVALDVKPSVDGWTPCVDPHFPSYCSGVGDDMSATETNLVPFADGISHVLDIVSSLYSMLGRSGIL